MSTTELVINEPNLWRLKTPGNASWPRTARPGDPRKYFIVSADAHVNEPADLWATRIDAKYRERIPRVSSPAPTLSSACATWTATGSTPR